jgi:hypothetical protein
MNHRPINVPLLAHSYRRLVLWFGAQLILNILAMPLGAVQSPSGSTLLLSVFVILGILATLLALAIYSYRTGTALGSSVPILWAIAMFLPCANVISLLALSAKATATCRANGIPVGFLGPRQPAPQATPPQPIDIPPSINP